MTPTPAATKVALVTTLAVTLASLAAFFAWADSPIDPEYAASFLWIYWVLFGLRVAGQLIARNSEPSWLPPSAQWNLTPYRLLLPAQVVILALMAWIYFSFWSERGPPETPRPGFGWLVLGFAAVYAAAMAIRYAVRMQRRPEQRWFGGTIPIVFHWVLAAFLVVYGAYHVSY
ncbi:MAG TPA: hypothetical protein VFR32_05385 [Gaiellaceae bacterium]|nr:hypothetical protein [Gaiellaceae bacterium]